MSACAHAASDRLLVCSHIVDDGAPIHLVCHHVDASWQVVCEHGAHETASEARIVCFNCFQNRHPDFTAISGLYPGGEAIAMKAEPGRWWVQPIEDIGSEQ